MIKVIGKHFNYMCFFIGFLIVLFVVFVVSRDLLPYDLISGGDFYLLYKPEEHFLRYTFAWINQVGQGSFNSIYLTAPYYILMAYFYKFGFNNYFIYPIFLILLGSYTSSYISIRRLNKSVKSLWIILLSLFYALNYVTLYIFTYTWGYTHHFLIYIFIPLILSQFLLLIYKDSLSLRDFFNTIFINTISLVSYSNLGFLFAVLTSEFLIFIFGILSNKLKKYQLIKGLFFTAIIQILLMLPYIITTIMVNYSGIKSISSPTALGGSLDAWNVDTSSLYVDAFITKGINTPFPYVVAFFLLPFILIRSLFKKELTISSFLILFLIAFSAKYHGPFGLIVKQAYQLPIMVLLRSPDKLFIFFPFFYLILMFELIGSYRDKITKATLILLLITSFYLFTGNTIVDSLEKKDSIYTYAINYPNEYLESVPYVNSDTRNTTIVSLPFSVKNSLGWSNYPTWGFVGSDILHLLYDRPYITSNTFDHPTYETAMSLKEWSEKDTPINEDLLLLKDFSIEYLIWHKDIDSKLYSNSLFGLYKIQRLRNLGVLSLVMSNSLFDLYKVNEDYVTPLIWIDNGDLIFSQESPVSYNIEVSNYSNVNSGTLVFNQAFEPGWQLFRLDSSNNKVLITKHLLKGNYANSWVLSTEDLDYSLDDISFKFSLEYTYQKYVDTHYQIIIFVTFISSVYLLSDWIINLRRIKYN